MLEIKTITSRNEMQLLLLDVNHVESSVLKQGHFHCYTQALPLYFLRHRLLAGSLNPQINSKNANLPPAGQAWEKQSKAESSRHDSGEGVIRWLTEAGSRPWQRGWAGGMGVARWQGQPHKTGSICRVPAPRLGSALQKAQSDRWRRSEGRGARWHSPALRQEG